MTPFDLILHFSLEHSTKFEVSSFNRSRKICWDPKIQKLGHVTPTRPLLIQFCIFFNSPPSVSVPYLKFLASNRSRDISWSQNSNIGSRDPHMTPFDLILYCFSLELTAVRLNAKFEVCSFNRSRDIRGSQNSRSGSRGPIFQK